MTTATIQARTEILATLSHRSRVYGSLFFAATFSLFCLFVEMPASAVFTFALLCGGGCWLSLRLGCLLAEVQEKCARGEVTDEQWQGLAALPKFAALSVFTVLPGCAVAVGGLYLLQYLPA